MRRGLLATRDELAQLRDHIGQRPFSSIYENLRKRCALILESRPVTETDWRSQLAQGRFAAALLAARTCQGRIFDLIISHHIDRNFAYRDRAIEEMKSLASWTTWTDPSHDAVLADLCTAECCVTMAVALDWLEEDLAEVDRLRCEHAMREKGIEPYAESVEQGAWWYSCYHNWNAVVNSGCGLAALALSEDDPHAMHAFNQARAGLKSFFGALGREGGWDEGVGYWGYAMRYLLLLGEAMDNVLDDRMIFRQRGMDTTGAFGVYFSPQGQSASFGDAASVPAHGALYSLARRYGARELCWWLDHYACQGEISTSGWSDAGLSLLLRPPDMENAPAAELSVVKVFNEIGWAAISDAWPEPSFYLAVKTGDLSANHSQLDMNSIQCQVDGEMLLTDPGSPPYSRQYFSDDRYKFHEAQARAHNTLIVAQREQRIDAQGQIVEAQEGPDYRWITASAGVALGENVRFNRHIIMTVAQGVGQMVIVLDELTNAIAERVEAMWHTFGELRIDDDAGVIVGQKTALHCRVAATGKFACSKHSHNLGNATDTALVVNIEPTNRLVLAMVFSRDPVGKMALKQTSRGDVSVHVEGVSMHFKGSRRHMLLDSITVG